MKILIAAGGSGGHIFPAIALAHELEKQRGATIVFAASRRALDRKILEGTVYKKIFFSINPMPYRLNTKVISFMAKMVY
ncbi:MAG: glycosyltransferase, partial [Candidatus Omnitrophica bacterium]|nr:glycosyltransferase [Candidatus Omnitrophota bacterium]